MVFIRGDANRNGEVGVDDAVMVLSFLFLGGVSLKCPDAADANDDGEVNLVDAVTILVGKFINPAVIAKPSPSIGRDPTTSDSFTLCNR